MEISPLTALDALSWQLAMGVDACVESEPQTLRPEVTATTQNKPSAQQAAPAQKPSATPLPSIATAVAEARALADASTSLAELEEAVRSFNGCILKKTATNTVFAAGVPASRLMFIG